MFIESNILISWNLGLKIGIKATSVFHKLCLKFKQELRNRPSVGLVYIAHNIFLMLKFDKQFEEQISRDTLVFCLVQHFEWLWY